MTESTKGIEFAPDEIPAGQMPGANYQLAGVIFACAAVLLLAFGWLMDTSVRSYDAFGDATRVINLDKAGMRDLLIHCGLASGVGAILLFGFAGVIAAISAKAER